MTEPGGTGADRPAFDPRHDARFQRGYQPGDAPRPPERRELIGPPPANPDTAAAGPGDDLDTLAFDGDTFHDELERSSWNPFITLLWAGGVLFVVVAVTLQWQGATYSFTNFSYAGSGPVPFGMLVQQLSYTIAPPMQIAGLLTLSGLLFWHAWAWRARRRRSAPSL
ncbi:hypothetical protein E3O42_03895 [Cryobacterium adonitolivorans]|uniref:Uncharacterized protein n=1 Tax=Cryobacterium adonitolivorans TaxID=1259189 RepID=A0A4R8WCE1_9MICO|nr:hypothetical protein [Cryobacterium adonitolivorans]TFC05157.1 hypothetical protein E3O42_03895 [Cryobacterium adonitolivorans]